MDYTTTISKRRRHNKVEYLARLRYYDAETGARKEKSKSAPTISEGKRRLRELEEEFEIGGQTAVESDLLTFADLVKHCKETRYCEAQFDVEGRKIIGVRGKSTVDSHIKALEDFFGTIKLREIRVANLRAYRKHRLFCKNRSGKRLNVATVNRELSTMRAMLNEAMVNDWILANPFKKVRPGELISIADERKRETILTTAEEKILLAACATESRRHLRVLVIAALDTGARQGELLNLRWSDVFFDEGIIKNVTSYKGRTVQRREVPLTTRLKAALLDLREKRGSATFRCSRLRGTGLAPSDFIERGWCREEQKIFYLVPALEIAQDWHGRHKRRLEGRDYDQAMILIGACHDASGINAADTIKNENFKPHPALGALLDWNAKHGATQTIRNAAARALHIYQDWERRNPDQVKQMSFFDSQ